MAFLVRCISGNSLKGLVRGEGDDDDLGGSGGSMTPNDTAHGGSRFSSYSWRRLSAKSRSSLNSPKKLSTPSLSSTSADGLGLPREAMEPVMERTASALTDLEAVKFLIEEWSRKHWRPATPQDQQRFDRLEQSDIQPLVALGEGAYGSVNLCRIPPAKLHGSQSAAGLANGVAATGGVAATDPACGEAGPAGLGRRKSGWGSSPPSGTGDLLERISGGAAAAKLPLDSAAAVEAVTAAAAAGAAGRDEEDDAAVGSAATLAEPATAVAATASAIPAAPGSSTTGCGPAQDGSVADPELIVAVKRVPLGWNQERELMQLHRCQQCPFIVRLFGFVDDGTEHCSYVMEWAEGGDLGVVLASLKDRRGADKQRLLMSESSARYYMGCLLLALEFLHGHGLLHRDIKPSNLLLTSDGTAKLADLGFTVALDANGHTVGCCGTAGYIAPEVYGYGTSKSRMCYGTPADIWSAGATLYQMLTGQVVTDNPEDVLKKGWRPPTHPRFSHHLQNLLNRMLVMKPTARLQSTASVMRQPWFAGFDWSALREGRMKAPYVPSERRRRVHDTVAAVAAKQPTPTPARTPSPAAAAPPPVTVGLQGRGGPPPPPSPPHKQRNPQHHHHLSTGAGSQRLATVMECVASQPGGLSEGDAVVQRSALSGQGEGSIRCGREGLVRDGASFETALGTMTTVEARAAEAVAMAASASVSVSGGRTAAAVAGAAPSGSPDATVAPGRAAIQPALTRGHRHGRGTHGSETHSMSVRFALGVAECA